MRVQLVTRTPTIQTFRGRENLEALNKNIKGKVRPRKRFSELKVLYLCIEILFVRKGGFHVAIVHSHPAEMDEKQLTKIGKTQARTEMLTQLLT